MAGKRGTVVTPWEVSGEVDYGELIERFGTKPLTPDLLERIGRHTGGLHRHLRRGVFFSHRDLDLVLDGYEEGERFVLYTGRGPSGPVHLGHLVPWVFTRHLQEAFGAELFFQFTDDERLLLLPGFDEAEADRWVFENARDVMALGFEPSRTEFIVNTRHPREVYPIALKIARRITSSTVRSVFGFDGGSSPGIMFFSAMQAAPCFIASERSGGRVPCLVPAGIDQDPYWRMTRDVAEKLGYPKPAQIHCRMLPGLGREAKMSSSIPETAIYTTDPPETVERKIMNAVTSERVPGSCPIYQYSYFLFEESDGSLSELAGRCCSGEVGCADCKAELAGLVNPFLRRHQRKRWEVRGLVARMLS